jgi:hypothetical protein
MRKFACLSLAGVALFIVAACNRTQPPPPSPFRLTATIKDIMDSEVDPSADFLWESVATIVSANGIEEKRPKTDDDWKEVRRRAITLLEATNLLMMQGRAVAKPGEKSENPGIELGPEEIEKVIASDRTAWINFAHALHDAGMKAFAAIEAKNADGLLDAGEAIDTACENCHLKYWYPLDEQAKKAATGAGSVRKS